MTRHTVPFKRVPSTSHSRLQLTRSHVGSIHTGSQGEPLLCTCEPIASGALATKKTKAFCESPPPFEDRQFLPGFGPDPGDGSCLILLLDLKHI